MSTQLTSKTVAADGCSKKEQYKMTQEKKVNGVNVDELFKTIELIKQNAEIAQFKFRTTNTWIDGTHNRGIVRGFYGALKEDTSREPLGFEMDEPPVLLGQNLGPNPVEYLLVALSGCLTTSLIAHAAAKGIEIKKVESRYEGDVDLRGFFGSLGGRSRRLSKHQSVLQDRCRCF